MKMLRGLFVATLLPLSLAALPAHANNTQSGSSAWRRPSGSASRSSTTNHGHSGAPSALGSGRTQAGQPHHEAARFVFQAARERRAGNPMRAAALTTRAAMAYESAGDTFTAASAYQNAADLYEHAGDHYAAAASAARAANLFRAGGHMNLAARSSARHAEYQEHADRSGRTAMPPGGP